MRVFRVIAVSFLACVTAAGAVFAADEPLEVHGGGRIGVVANSKGGSQSGILQNDMGSMPNYGESRYWNLAISKKTTADGGAWAKVSTNVDQCIGDTDGDLQAFNLRMRDFHVEFGGLDFMPSQSVLWGGLRGYGAGWNGQQDYAFISFAGVGFGIEKIGGLFSFAYMGEDSTSEDAVKGLGERTTHNIILNVNVPQADVFAAYGYSKKGDVTGEKNLNSLYVGGVAHAPMSVNVGAQVSTNAYAKEIYFANYDTALKGNNNGGATNYYDGTALVSEGNDKAIKYTGVALALWSVTDIMPGLYVAPALRYDMIQVGKDALPSAYQSEYSEVTEGVDLNADGDATDTKVLVNEKFGKKNTLNKLGVSLRLSKALTKNIALVPTLGYHREWDKEKVVNAKPLQLIQATLGVEIALNQGFGGNAKLQFYGTYNKIDKDHKAANGGPLGAGYEDKTSSTVFGMLMTCGF